MDCESVQSRLIEYIEHTLPDDDQAALETHLRQCENCRLEHDSLVSVITTALDNPVPEPGNAHWQAFPDQVLAAFKAQTQANPQIQRNQRWWSGFINWWQATTWQTVAVPAMLVAITIASVIYWQTSSTEPTFNSLVFQQEIKINAQHADIIKHSDNQRNTANHFAFSEGVTKINSFRIGMSYSETLALLGIRDMDAARVHFALLTAAIAKLDSTLAPELERISRMFATGNDLQTLLATLGSLQPRLEQSTSIASHEARTLFRLGSWLNDIKLALISNPEMLSAQMATIEYFIKNLQTAPRGVNNNLQQLHTMIRNSITTEAQKQQAIQLINNIQLVLG